MSDKSDPTLTATVTVDGKEIPCCPGEVIIKATDRAGIHIPRFCYHPRMKPVGMCRMCLVEVSGPRGMTLQPACFIGITEGMEVVTDSEKVKKAQDGVLEFLLINHPLDCPVCDKGGECPLQDQTLAYGPAETRFVEEKRHWAKPIALSDLVLLDRERCIQCGRCIRFADEIAGEPMIDFLSRGDDIEVAIFPEEEFTSYFSGNTVQICPVGALTSTPYRFAARPWDLEQVESTCNSCAMGCRVVVQSSANQLIRLLGVDSEPVNQSWLCDKGRYSYEAHTGASRVSVPMVRRSLLATGNGSGEDPSSAGVGELVENGSGEDPSSAGVGELVETTWAEALRVAAGGLRRVMESAGPDSVAVLGGARLANEDAYAWAKLAKSVIGTDSVDCDLGDGLPAGAVFGLPRATIDDTCTADLVILAGAEVHEVAPILYLRLKAAVQSGTTKILELSVLPSAMSRFATRTLLHRPGELGVLLETLGAALPPRGPNAGIDPSHVAGVPADELASARALVDAASSIVVVHGRASVSESPSFVSTGVSGFAAGRPDACFLPLLRRANTQGAFDAGLAPGYLPGGIPLDEGRALFGGESAWGKVPAGHGLGATGILRAVADGDVRALVLLGADPVGDTPDHRTRAALASGAFIVAVTAHLTESARMADVVLPSAMYAERGGTITNFEGRVSTIAKKIAPPGQAWEDWAIAAELAVALGSDLGFESIDGICAERERLVPLYKHAGAHVWTSPEARDGLLLPLNGERVGIGRIPAAIDPMATPGIGSLTHHMVRPRSSRRSTTNGTPIPDAGSDAGTDPRTDAGTGAENGGSPIQGRRYLGASTPRPVSEVPGQDAYSLRLVSPRMLYDRGTHVAGSPHLAMLAAPGALRVNHYDLDRLGATSGDVLRVVSAGGAREMAVEVDDSVPRGVCVLPFNAPPVPGSTVVAADLMDASAPVTDIRLEAL